VGIVIQFTGLSADLLFGQSVTLAAPPSSGVRRKGGGDCRPNATLNHSCRPRYRLRYPFHHDNVSV